MILGTVFTTLHYLTDLTNKLECYTWLMRLARDKHSSLLAQLVDLDENEFFVNVVLLDIFFNLPNKPEW
jgi:hypothetical protein